MSNQIVRRVCGEFYVPGKSYHSPLPQELQNWYAYCSDGGHCIVCCLEQDAWQVESDLTNYLLPVPVKTVLRKYETLQNYLVNDLCYIVVNIPYSSEIGLTTPPEDEEL